MTWLQNLLTKLKFDYVPPVEEIAWASFDSWVRQQVLDFSSQRNIIKKWKDYTQTLQEWQGFLLSKLDQVEERVKSPSENSAQRLGQQMLLQQVRSLAEKMKFFSHQDLLQVADLSNSLETELDLLLEKAAKTHLENSLFLDQESLPGDDNPENNNSNFLVQELEKLKTLGENFSGLLQHKVIRNAQELRRRKKILDASLEEEKKLQRTFQSKSEQLAQTVEKLEEKETELLQLYGDESKEVLSKRRALLAKLKENRERVLFFFTQLDELLQQGVSRLPLNHYLRQYLKNAPEALYNDTSLQVLSFLTDLQQRMLAGSLSLPLRQVERFIPLLEKASDYLKETQREYLQLKQELAQLPQKPLTERTQLQISDTNYRLEHYQQRVELLEEEIKELTEQLAEKKQFCEREISLFQELIKITFEREIKIKMEEVPFVLSSG